MSSGGNSDASTGMASAFLVSAASDSLCKVLWICGVGTGKELVLYSL